MSKVQATLLFSDKLERNSDDGTFKAAIWIPELLPYIDVASPANFGKRWRFRLIDHDEDKELPYPVAKYLFVGEG